MYELQRGPANPSTLREGRENLGPSQSRAQPLQEVCSPVLQDTATFTNCWRTGGRKRAYLGEDTPGRAEEGAGEALGVYKASDPESPGDSQLWTPFRMRAACLFQRNWSFPFSLWLLLLCSTDLWSSGPTLPSPVFLRLQPLGALPISSVFSMLIAAVPFASLTASCP